MRKLEKTHPPDAWLMCVTVALIGIGLLLVFDASYAKGGDLRVTHYDTWYFAKRQLVAAGIGIFLMFCASQVSLKRYRGITPWLLAVVVGMLVVVLIPGVGSQKYGARSWFSLGPLSMQPSEFAKLALILYLAAVLGKPRTFAKRAPKIWVEPLLVALGIVGLVVVERDLGTPALLLAMILAIFAAAGAKKRYLLITGAAGLAVVTCLMLTLSHCKPRVDAFRDPWSHRTDRGFQIVQSLSGLAKGGLTGVGLCEGGAKTYMPAASTDYVFTTLGEETGLLGGLGLIFLFGIFVYRGFDLAMRCKSNYSALLAVGVTSMVGIQTAVNLAVVTNTIPATGLPLPFISYGGSSLVISLVSVGVLLSVSKQVDVDLEEEGSSESSRIRRRNGRAHLSRNQRGTGPSRGGSWNGAAVRR